MTQPALRLTTPADATDAAQIWAALSDAEQAQIVNRRRMVDEWRSTCRRLAGQGESKARATAVFLELHPELCRTTLYDWGKRRDDADPAALLDGRKARVGKLEPTFESVGEAAWSQFLGYYLTIHRRSVALCHTMVGVAAEQHAGDPAWSWPTLRTVQRKVAEIPATQSDYYRLGEREWSRQHMQSVPRDYSQYRSGECWVGDFHEFDIFCRRSEDDPTIIRPLLGSFLDLRSCKNAGWFIGEAETADAVLLTLADGIRKLGAPWSAVIDNGKPYRASGVSGGRPRSSRLIGDEDAFRRQIAVLPGLHIACHFSEPYRPNSKRVERWHRTVEEQFGAAHDTYCGGLKDDRFRVIWERAHDHPELCPTVDQLRSAFGAWLEAYHAHPSQAEGLEGLSPNAAFEKFEPIPRSVCPDDALEILLLKTYNPRVKTDSGERCGVLVGKDGVRYQGIQYGSSDPRLWDLHGQWLPLRVHPTDASFVIVCDAQGRPLIRCVNNRAALAGVSRDDVSKAIRSQKRARRYAKEIRAGVMVPATQSTVDAAIAGRMTAARAAQVKILAATGTDRGSQCPVPSAQLGGGVTENPEPGTRNLTPLRSDFAAAVERFKHRAPQPPAETLPALSLTDLAATLDADPQAATSPERAARGLSFVDLFGAGA